MTTNTFLRLIGYALLFLVVVGILGIDIYLILEWLKHPAVTWGHLGTAWFVAFANVIAIFLTGLVYSAAKD